jgi:hypothetical protein
MWLCLILGCYSGGHKDQTIIFWDVTPCSLLTFRRNILPPSSESKSKGSKQYKETSIKQSSFCCFSFTASLLGLLLDPEDRFSMSLRNVGKLLADEAGSHPRREYSPCFILCENIMYWPNAQERMSWGKWRYWWWDPHSILLLINIISCKVLRH